MRSVALGLARASTLLVVLALAGGCPAPPLAAAPVAADPSIAPLDLIVANGRVVDGTGAPWLRADVGVAGGRIVAVGDLSRTTAHRRIDVHGEMVAPGFIDMLGQSEYFTLIDNRVESKTRQGITTEITGEGGASVAPMNDAFAAEGKAFQDRYHLVVDWRDLAGYRRRFEAARSTINLGTYVGAANLRAVVLGLGRVDPTPAQLAEMERLLDVAMDQGAMGVSTSLIYPPDSYAKTPELVALAKVAARHGGTYATHMRSEADDEPAALDEVFTIAREAKIPVQIFHLKVAGKKNWGKMRDVVARIERARAEGLDVAANMYPYAAASNVLSANAPEWASDGGIDAMIRRFHDPAQRERIKGELWHSAMGDEDPADILLAACSNPSLKPLMGKRLTEAAKEMNRSPEDALLDIVEADRGTTLAVRFWMREDDVTFALAQPWVSIGLDSSGQATDGPFAQELVHPRGFGSMPRVIGHYARDEHLFSIEEAVRKITSLPAGRMHLADRGLLRPGMAADVTVFDPARIRDVATFEAPLRYSEGIDWVVVNGKVVLDAGKLTDERPGQFLSRDTNSDRVH